MKKGTVFLIMVLLLTGVAQAVEKESIKANQLVIDDISSIQREITKQYNELDEQYSEKLFANTITVKKESSSFQLFLMSFCLCIFLIPMLINLVRVRLNEKRIRNYMDNKHYFDK